MVAKWKQRPERPRTHGGVAPAAAPVSSASPKPGTLLLIAIAVLAVAGGFWFVRSRFSSDAPEASLFRKETGETEVHETAGTDPEFDMVLELPGSPAGLASNGQELVIGNRTKPWGAIRLRSTGAHFVAKQIPIFERQYRQQMSVSTLTWNGKNYVGVTTASWFGNSNGFVFTIHDPDTLQIVGTKPAPPLLGGLAWDGSAYWASTRKNTEDANEEAYLYKLDRDFNVLAKSAPPAVGCQGLAWDGKHLWFVDVFRDSIYVLDVSGAEPRVVHTASTPLDYLSGIAWHDHAIWITEYGEHRVRRLRETTRAAWLGTTPQPAVEMASAISPPHGGESLEELRKKLRSESWAERMSAEMKLDELHAPIDFARDQNNFADRKPDGTEDIDWSIELRDNAVWLVSSRLWFGHDMFVPRTQNPSMVTVPVFARYTFTTRQPDGRETEREFDATAGENVVSGVRLADANASGEYNVSLFIHVQYIDATGTGRILNDSAGSLDLRK